MVNASIVPAGLKYQKLLLDSLAVLTVLKKRVKVKINEAGLKDLKDHLVDVGRKIYYVRRNTKVLARLLERAKPLEDDKRAKLYFEKLKPLMEHIRRHVDDLERVVSDESWDLPKYREMLFVK